MLSSAAAPLAPGNARLGGHGQRGLCCRAPSPRAGGQGCVPLRGCRDGQGGLSGGVLGEGWQQALSAAPDVRAATEGFCKGFSEAGRGKTGAGKNNAGARSSA